MVAVWPSQSAAQGLRAWQGAVQFRNGIKRCCGGGLPCPGRRGGFEKSLMAGKRESEGKGLVQE